MSCHTGTPTATAAESPEAEADRPWVELLFNGDGRRLVKTKAWVTHGLPEERIAMVFVELDRAAVRKLAGATRLELRRNGRPVLTLHIAGTPDRAKLEPCIPPPGTPRGCAE